MVLEPPGLDHIINYNNSFAYRKDDLDLMVVSFALGPAAESRGNVSKYVVLPLIFQKVVVFRYNNRSDLQ